MKIYTKAIKSVFLVLFLGIVSLHTNAQNNALNFDGVDDYVEIPYNNNFTPFVYSVQLAVEINDASATQAIFSNGGINSTGGYIGFALYAYGGNWTIFYGQGSTSWGTVVGPAITPAEIGTWTNIAGTYDGSTLKLYINGVLENTAYITPITPNTLLPIRLGAGGNEALPPTYYFGGTLDELSMWNITLTQAQITHNMNNSLAGTEAGLITYYNFNEGIGNGNNLTPTPVNTLTDGTANAQNGTLNNFALTGNTSNWVTSDLILPVNLINFSGSKQGSSNLLQWSTASEQNSSYFEVQRSDNSTDFTTIAKVAAAGNSNTIRNYQYNDAEVSSSTPIYYYRLNMVDIDGSGKYSSIIYIKNGTGGGLTSVYPNPARDQVTINVSDNSLINTQVLLSGLDGKVLQRIPLNQTSTQVDISNYSKGVYILKFVDGSSIKIIKE